MSNTRVRFNNKKYSDFSAELKEKVNKYFEDNKKSIHANPQMVIKTIIMFAMYFGPYALILTNAFNGWQMLALCVISGLGAAGIGFSVQHDANHGAYSSNDTVNKMLGFSLSLIGGNDYMWRIKHNVLHHTYTNIHGKDEDISVAKMLRLSPNAEHQPIHKMQHLFAWLAYSLLTLFWVFYSDYPKIKRYNGYGSPNEEVKHPAKELVGLFAMKAFYLGYAIIIPVIVLDVAWWQVLIGFTVMHLVAGFVITVVFQLAHIIETTNHPEPDQEGMVDNSWMVHQFETTANFAINNKWLTWFVGGLNFQVEHHLFPKICSIHYPTISKIVKATAEKYQVPYNVESTLGSAIVSHYKTLKKLAEKEQADHTPQPLEYAERL